MIVTSLPVMQCRSGVAPNDRTALPLASSVGRATQRNRLRKGPNPQDPFTQQSAFRPPFTVLFGVETPLTHLASLAVSNTGVERWATAGSYYRRDQTYPQGYYRSRPGRLGQSKVCEYPNEGNWV